MRSEKTKIATLYCYIVANCVSSKVHFLLIHNRTKSNSKKPNFKKNLQIKAYATNFIIISLLENTMELQKCIYLGI